jgi:hypothetical protein
MSPDIEARLDRFVPACLSADAWATARWFSIASGDEDTSAGPSAGPGAALGHAWVPYFPTVWEESAAPDLTAMLTSEDIAVNTPAASTGPLKRYRAILRRFAVVLASTKE